MSDHDAEFGLVMPFVVVKSKDGPYEDDAYVAGFEAGRLDALLEHDLLATATALDLPLHAENLPQLDLIAMRRGYVMDIEHSDDGWSFVSFAAAVEAGTS